MVMLNCNNTSIDYRQKNTTKYCCEMNGMKSMEIEINYVHRKKIFSVFS